MSRHVSESPGSEIDLLRQFPTHAFLQCDFLNCAPDSYKPTILRSVHLAANRQKLNSVMTGPKQVISVAYQGCPQAPVPQVPRETPPTYLAKITKGGVYAAISTSLTAKGATAKSLMHPLPSSHPRPAGKESPPGAGHWDAVHSCHTRGLRNTSEGILERETLDNGWHPNALDPPRNPNPTEASCRSDRDHEVLPEK